MNRPSPTPEQQEAIDATGDVLVIAGAGTGKTRTLVDRCLEHLTRVEDPVPLDAVLLVTFTEAAATEMRERLRRALEERVAAEPHRADLAQQRLLLETAHISTLHSFCLRLVRDHFHEVRLDPELTVLPAERARVLADEILDALVREQYAANTPAALALQDMLLDSDRSRDTEFRGWILKIHAYSRSLADPDGWFAEQERVLEQTHPSHWESWLVEGFSDWRERWLPALESQPEANTKASSCALALQSAGARPDRAAMSRALRDITDQDREWPRSTPQNRFRDPIKGFFEDAAFLGALAEAPESGQPGADPLAQDWQWTRGPLLTLLRLTREFGRRFAAARRELGAVDFQDLEQHAIQLLWDKPHRMPSPIALAWQQRLALVFVDEYQDINEAQDCILRALGRPAGSGNRFLVGDMKQSIYRFRLANPRIFQEYAARWRAPGSGARTLALTTNFRSAPGILTFVNRMFAPLMQAEVGGIAYADDQFLQPAEPAPAPEPNAAPPVEFQLLITEKTRGNDDSREDATRVEREAACIADRLRAMRRDGFLVRERSDGARRPVRWNDMAVLLRAPAPRAETYARVFERRGVPLVLTRPGFYESLEIQDLLNVFRLLDNPLQDQPLAAVLHSPLASLSPDELALVRLARPRGPLWTALTRLGAEAPRLTRELSNAPAVQSAAQKARDFLARFTRWRELSRAAPLSECLEDILDVTGYEAWLAVQPRGQQALANLRKLLGLTRQFDQFQRQGLHRFLRHVESQRNLDHDLEPGAAEPTDAVQLLSVHQAKGLEFPVVAVADCAHGFNKRDFAGRVLLDEVFGLCSLVQPPGLQSRYPSLPHWLARQRGLRESLGEEIRLLYVALTRARDHLILTATSSQEATEAWPGRSPGPRGYTTHQLLSARCWLDWIGPILCHLTGCADWTTPGLHPCLSWQCTRPDDPPSPPPPDAPPTDPHPNWHLDDSQVSALRHRLEWQYPHTPATRLTAKASVTQLRHHAPSSDDPATQWFQPRPRRPSQTPGTLSAAAIGSAHHRVLEAVSLDLPVTRQSLLNALRRLQEAGELDDAQCEAINLDSLEAFWNSELGRDIQAQAGSVHREVPFTARLSAADLAACGLPQPADPGPEEFVVVQGVADLLVQLPGELWLVDFKTDNMDGEGLDQRVAAHRPQMRLYATALGRIHRKPVTRCCLHFLARQQTVCLAADLPPGPLANP